MQDTKYKKLINNSLILAIGNFGSKLINFFMVGIYTLYMSTGDYGKGDIILTTVNLLLPVVTLSVFEGLLRYVLDDKEEKETIFANALLVVLVGNILFFLGFYLFSVIMSFDKQVEYAYFFSLLLMQSLQMLFSQYVKAIDKLKIYAINGVLVSVGTFAFGLVFLKVFHLGLAGYMYSLIIANCLSLVFLSLNISFRQIREQAEFSWEKIKEILRYSIPLIPNSIMWWVITASSRYILTYYYDYQITGIYAAANKIPSLLSVITSIFIQAWQLSAIEVYRTEDEEYFFKKVYRDYIGIISMATSLILLFLPLLTKIMLSNEFIQGWKYIPILLLANLFSSAATFLGTNYIIAKKTIGIITTSLFAALLNLVCSLLLIPNYGPNGASIGSLCGFLLMFILRTADSKRLMGWRFSQNKLIISVIFLLGQISIIFFTTGVMKYVLEIIIFLGLCYENRRIFLQLAKNIKKIIKGVSGT